MKKMSIRTTDIASIEMGHRYESPDMDIRSTLADTRKENRSSSQWKNLLADIICNEYCNRMTVFCDGSQDKEAVGCGIWSKRWRRCRMVQLMASILPVIHQQPL